MIGLGHFIVFGSVFEVWADEPLASELESGLADLRYVSPAPGDVLPDRSSRERSVSPTGSQRSSITASGRSRGTIATGMWALNSTWRSTTR